MRDIARGEAGQWRRDLAGVDRGVVADHLQVLPEATAAGGDGARRVFEAMMEMGKIDGGGERARRG